MCQARQLVRYSRSPATRMSGYRKRADRYLSSESAHGGLCFTTYAPYQLPSPVHTCNQLNFLAEFMSHELIQGLLHGTWKNSLSWYREWLDKILCKVGFFQFRNERWAWAMLYIWSLGDPALRVPESYNPADHVIAKLSVSKDTTDEDVERVEVVLLLTFLWKSKWLPFMYFFFSVYNGDVPRKYHGRWIERTYTNWINKTRKHHGGVQRKTQTQVLFFSFERLVSLNVWLWRELFSNWLWLNPFNADLQIRICRYWCSVNINSTQTMFLYPKFLP